MTPSLMLPAFPAPQARTHRAASDNGKERFYGQRETDKHPRIGEIYELVYWRKHPDLHGFIVTTFADGVDNCQQIWLSDNDIETII